MKANLQLIKLTLLLGLLGLFGLSASAYRVSERWRRSITVSSPTPAASPRRSERIAGVTTVDSEGQPRHQGNDPEAPAVQSGGSYNITQSAISGGGGSSSNGNTGVIGTLGQSGAGTSSGGAYSVSGGFFGGGGASGNCAVGIDRSGDNFLTAGGSGTIQVTADPTCAWSATSTDPFVIVTSGASGGGNGSVEFNVLANTGVRRTASINVGDKEFSVRQSASFSDVDPGSVFAPFIQKVSAAGITLGCGQDAQGHPIYCPQDQVLREQMAAFIIRSLGMPNPPIPGSQRFQDVPPSSPFYAFIDQLAIRGITVGCNPPDQTLYCPSSGVTREQMAAFIIRAVGMPNPPQPQTQRFADVLPSNPFYAFIDQMAVRGITTGCNPPAGTMYCPSGVVTRDQMAAFLVRAFGL